MTIFQPSSSTLLDYLLHLADNALILGHRNSEWTGHGPILEQDIAISNIALDLVGQARYFYQYAATLRAGSTEDTLAYLRDVREFKNCLLVELQNGDWAASVLRQFFFSAYQYFLFGQLQGSADATIAAIAEKSLKEARYHLRWSSEWVIRLGDGTAESHARLGNALSHLWMYTGELTSPAEYELRLADKKIAVNPALIRENWMARIDEVFEQAFLEIPVDSWMQSGGKQGQHTEHLGYILAEMQYLQRAYPGCEW
ncbi:MAG: 1,2-phenylacetyl-CoA epoxidase subunit PaaC [Chitinophagaceae bacterium]